MCSDYIKVNMVDFEAGKLGNKILKTITEK